MNRNELIGRLGRNTTALVCGLGITGIETALWLRREGRNVICVERLSRAHYESKDKFFRLSELENAGVQLVFGVDGEAVAPYVSSGAVQLAILSPGISLASALVGTLRRLAIPCVTELELGVLLAGVRTIMVTGSNGKSTTVSLIHHLLQAAGKRSLLCGNVGTPVVAEFRSGELEQGLAERFDFLVVEASSYQLEACESLAPDVGVILNLSDNHLERHGSMERYREAKLSMVARQSVSQTVVLNRDDSLLIAIAGRLPGQVVTFGASALSAAQGTSVLLQNVVRVQSAPGQYCDFDTTQSQLRGSHNRQNIAAALAALMAAGIDVARLGDALRSFTPLEHRLEYVTTEGGAQILNDSKSTTVAATVAALKATVEEDAAFMGRVVLCVGGAAKAGSWVPLITQLKRLEGRTAAVVCFGQDGAMIADHLQSNTNVEVVTVKNVHAAVEQARAYLNSGDLLLFSPGCASMDEFSDFEHRGREFKRYVKSATAQSADAAVLTHSL